MSRSKHTIPPRLRAPRRVRAPHEPRGFGEDSARQTIARALKGLGIRFDCMPDLLKGEEPAPLPRLRVGRPRAGFHHPASRADLARILRFFGERCTYGLQSVEMVRGDAALPGSRMQFGRLLVPGRIMLYDQPRSPWVLAGRLPGGEEERLGLAGALIEAADLWTVVTWPGDTLRDFMLFDVLMHEVGHHLIQQYKGKRPARVARTKDHEAFAARFGRRCRLVYAASNPSPR
jgi:hypothetical protein